MIAGGEAAITPSGAGKRVRWAAWRPTRIARRRA